jgi:hypothetical protein
MVARDGDKETMIEMQTKRNFNEMHICAFRQVVGAVAAS